MNFLNLPSSTEQKIYAAFDGVRLNGGIGYFEAYAIDGYVAKNSQEYQMAIEKDLPDDWTALVSDFQRPYDEIAIFYMDAMGLHYYLPVFLLTGTALTYFQDNFLKAMEIDPVSEYSKLYLLLTSAQKECILEVYEWLADHSGWVKYFMNDCYMSRTEAIEKAESESEFIDLQRMRKHLSAQ